jgi:hypothetical protein
MSFTYGQYDFSNMAVDPLANRSTGNQKSLTPDSPDVLSNTKSELLVSFANEQFTAIKSEFCNRPGSMRKERKTIKANPPIRTYHRGGMSA